MKQTMDRISGLADKEIPRCYQQFFWFGILLLSDLLDFRYFGRYRSPLFVYFPPFLPPFFQKGVGAPQKGAIAPLLRKKGGTAPFVYRNVHTEFSFGMVLVIPEKY